MAYTLLLYSCAPEVYFFNAIVIATLHLVLIDPLILHITINIETATVATLLNRLPSADLSISKPDRVALVVGSPFNAYVIFFCNCFKTSDADGQSADIVMVAAAERLGAQLPLCTIARYCGLRQVDDRELIAGAGNINNV